MLQRWVSKSWIAALGATAALGVVAASLWGAGPAAPEGKQASKAPTAAAQGISAPSRSSEKLSLLAKLGASALAEKVPQANIAVAAAPSRDCACCRGGEFARPVE